MTSVVIPGLGLGFLLKGATRPVQFRRGVASLFDRFPHLFGRHLDILFREYLDGVGFQIGFDLLDAAHLGNKLLHFLGAAASGHVLHLDGSDVLIRLLLVISVDSCSYQKQRDDRRQRSTPTMQQHESLLQ